MKNLKTANNTPKILINKWKIKQFNIFYLFIVFTLNFNILISKVQIANQLVNLIANKVRKKNQQLYKKTQSKGSNLILIK